jgi:hypothetical protein
MADPGPFADLVNALGDTADRYISDLPEGVRIRVSLETWTPVGACGDPGAPIVHDIHVCIVGQAG